MAETVHFEKHGRVALVTLDSPPVNALGAALRAGIAECLAKAADDPEVAAIVITGKGRGFSGGADIREFGKPPKDPHLRAIIVQAEDCPKPVIAAIHGMAVGGGLELSLGCHYRIGDQSARVGLPEIKLGLLPGAGGTQRLPRLIGVAPALEIITSGDYIPADKASKLGLLDRVAGGDLVEAALAFAGELVAAGAGPRKSRELPIPGGDAASEIGAARKALKRRARGLIAPFRCVDSVENATRLPFDEAMAKEREYFVECLESEQSRGQRHIFFAEREAAKVADLPKDEKGVEVRQAAVIGCGTMGGGIAMNFANAGIPVTVVESSGELLDKGLEVVRRNYQGSVARGRIDQAEMDRRMALITGVTEFEAIAEADIVIEAVFEEMALKKQVYGTLDRVCKPGAILATNTSTLDIDEIAAATSRPEAVIGTHFFSPANVMRLMENVRGRKSSHAAIATVMTLARRIGKVPVLVGVCDGFVGNRMLYAYTRQANALILEGALPQQIDKVIYDFGLPMGPFAMNDLAGIDVGWRIRQRRAKDDPKALEQSPVGDRLYEMGRYGQKTGAGWYRYEKGDRTAHPDSEVEKIILEIAAGQGIERREIGDQEILERCLYPLVNEGALILEEDLAARASDIDVVWVYGYGFPAHRGGPMFWADRVGTKAIHQAMERLHQQHGERLEPAPLLKRLADEGKGFGDL